MPSPFLLTKLLKGLVKSVAKSAWLLPKIFWDPTALIPTAIHNGVAVSVESFSKGVKKLQRTLASKISKALFMELSEVDALSLSGLEERMDNCEPAQGFVTFNGRVFRPLCSVLLRKISKMRATGNFNYRRWFEEVDSLVGPLVALIHLTSGMPARSTEYVPLLSLNDGAYRQRSVYVTMGRLCFVFDYNKAEVQSSKTRLIPRFLDEQSSRLWAWYLGVLQPMYW
jgi:hypothetical protein